MAMFTSALMVTGSGSIGGITITRNRYAQLIARQRTKPVDPGTIPQYSIRATMSAAVERWQSLTDDQRAKWGAFADNVVLLNKLGLPFSPTGQNMYVGTFVHSIYFTELLFAYGDLDEAPSAELGMLPLPDVKLRDALFAPGIGIPVSIYNGGLFTIHIVVQVSDEIPPSRNYWKGPWLPGAFAVFTIPADQSVLYDIAVGDAADQKFAVRFTATTATAPIRYSHEFIIKAYTLEEEARKVASGSQDKKASRKTKPVEVVAE